MQEYDKTEIIRSSIQDVQKRAAEEKKRRESPNKTYSNAKSMVAKNMKAQVKGKKMEKKEGKIPQWQQGIRTANFVDPRRDCETSPERTNQIKT